MAIYHASFQIVKRSAGRSAIAASAYRSGERLIDERTGEVHDYTRKGGVDDTFIMAPENAPEWAHDREALWNAVELGETRKNSQVARELNVALPIELSKTASRELLEDYVQSAFVEKGMIADVAMHTLDSDNPHAHVMLTLREISTDGFTTKNRDWNHKDQLVEWREGWANAVNNHLERHSINKRIDHRSLQKQGIERMPSVHLGPHASAMEARGIKTFKGDLNRRSINVNKLVVEISTGIASQVHKTQRNLTRSAGRLSSAILKGSEQHGSMGSTDLKHDEHEQDRSRSRGRGGGGIER